MLLNVPNFQEWIDLLDHDLLDAAQSVKSWATTIVFVAILGGLTHLIPGASEFVGLDLRPALVVFALAALVGTWNAWRFERGASLRQVVSVMILEEALLIVFSIAALSFAQGNAQSFLGFVCLMVASYQGVILQTTVKHPFGLIGIVGGIGASVALFEPARAPVYFILLYPITIFLHLLAGAWAKQVLLHKRQTTQYREALLAQRVLETTSQNEQLQHTLTDLLGLRHDLNNLFQVIEATSSLLALGELDEDQEELVQDMNHAHRRMRTLLRGFTTTTSLLKPSDISSQPEYEVLDLSDVLDRFTQAVKRREPDLELATEMTSNSWVAVHGGTQTLERVLDNLVRNAKEGNGEQGASKVQLSLARSPDGGRYVLIVEDDGPGFMESMLKEGVQIFQTTKENGTGLGLYIIDRIIAAHEGTMKQGISDLGGAKVEIHLPVRKPPAQTKVQEK